MYFRIRGYRAVAWNLKDLNIGGSGLTRINYGNISSTHKFVDTLKYYKQSLSQLTKTATEQENDAIKDLTAQYIANHDYFSNVWKTLKISEKN